MDFADRLILVFSGYIVYRYTRGVDFWEHSVGTAKRGVMRSGQWNALSRHGAARFAFQIPGQRILCLPLPPPSPAYDKSNRVSENKRDIKPNDCLW